MRTMGTTKMELKTSGVGSFLLHRDALYGGKMIYFCLYPEVCSANSA